VSVGIAAGDLFAELGVPMLAGRAFTEDDPPDAVVISQNLAWRLAGRDVSRAVGRDLVIGDRARRVTGVLPPSFDIFAEDVELWLPAAGVAPLMTFGKSDVRSYHAIVRLADGVPVASAREQAAHVHAGLLPEGGSADQWRVDLIPMRGALIGDTHPVLMALAAAAALLLLVACANVAILLVNRAVMRAREQTLRLALGATHGRLVRTAFAETAAIAGGGALCGWGAAHLFVRWLQPVLPSVATASGVPLAGTAFIVAIAITLLCGVAPALAVNRVRLSEALNERHGTGGPISRRLRDVLVVAQVAVAVALLAGAAVLGRSLAFLRQVDIGIKDPAHILTLTLPLTETTRFDDASRAEFVEELVRRVRDLPGVAAAGVGSNLPPAEPHMIFTIRVTTDDSSVDQTRAFDFVSVTDGYLDALGTRIEQGRTLTEGDRLADRPVAVLSETTARFLAPVGPVLNRQLGLALPTSTGKRVQPFSIGVVADVRYNGLDKSGRGSVYVPWRQLPMATGYLVVRTAADATSVAPAVLRIARDIDPTLPLDAPRTLEEEIQHSLAPRSTRFAVIGGFAAVALMLAIVGLSSALIRRDIEGRRDLAIRIALGATPGRAIHFVVARGLWLSLTGLVLGTGTALLAARAFSALVVGVSPYDPATYLVIAAGIVVVALGACYLPARRAASVDAIELLRAG
jgi:putative ABC transport system permease protein